MPFLEWVLFRLVLFVVLPLGLLILAVGPARFWGKVCKAWGWVWGTTLQPEQLIARVVKHQQEHITELRQALAKLEATEAEILRNLGKSESGIGTLDQEARALAARGDDLGAKASLYQLNLERLAVQTFRDQLDRQRQQITDARKRLYLVELQLRQYEVGRSILLGQLAQARTLEQQYDIAHRFDPFSAVANWQKAEGMVQQEAVQARAIGQVQIDLADMPLAGQPAQIDPGILDAQLAELKASLKHQHRGNGPPRDPLRN